MNVVNLTPHAVTLRNAAGEDFSYPSAGVARVGEAPTKYREIVGVPVPVASATQFTEVVGLPDPVEGTIYIVSAMVAGVARRADVFSPGTGPNHNPVRNDKGHIVAVTCLVVSV